MTLRRPSLLLCLLGAYLALSAFACGAEETASVLDHFIAHSGGGDFGHAPIQTMLLDVTGDERDELFLSALIMTGNDGNTTWHVYTPSDQDGQSGARFLGTLVLQDDGFHFDENTGRLIHVTYVPDGEGYQTLIDACTFHSAGFTCVPAPDLIPDEGVRSLLQRNRAWTSSETTRLARVTLRELREAARGDGSFLALEGAGGKSTFELSTSWLTRPVVRLDAQP